MSKVPETFQEVKTLVLKWLEKKQAYLTESDITTTILRDEINGLVVSLENTECMAEIVVEHPDFAPYRFISFEVAAIEENQAKIVYSWYDTTGTTDFEIIANLDNGIAYLNNCT